MKNIINSKLLYESFLESSNISSKDLSLGDRMKILENTSRTYFPKRDIVFVRLDGKSFKSYTSKLKKPFDLDLAQDLLDTAHWLIKHIPNAILSFSHSDEISLVLQPRKNDRWEPWFGGNINKIISVTASMASSYFNSLRIKRYGNDIKLAIFDSRAWSIDESMRFEIINYLIWRHNDCKRNAINAIAQSVFSDSELHGKRQAERIVMLESLDIKLSQWDSRLINGNLLIAENIELGKSQETNEIITKRDIKSYDMIDNLWNNESLVFKIKNA
jgi:tRNA(His) 5'-end guanylyltransferase